MSKKKVAGGAKKKTGKARNGASSKGATSNLLTLIDKGAIDKDAATALTPGAKKKIEKLSKAEVRALINAHLLISPNRRWRPDPDGSIF